MIWTQTYWSKANAEIEKYGERRALTEALVLAMFNPQTSILSYLSSLTSGSMLFFRVTDFPCVARKALKLSPAQGKVV